MVQLQKFTNLMSLLSYFKDETVCKDYLETIRWNGELKCAYADCGHDKVYKCKGRFKCSKCKRIYSVRVGTILRTVKFHYKNGLLLFTLLLLIKKVFQVYNYTEI